MTLTTDIKINFEDHEHKGSDFGAMIQRTAMEARAMGAIMSNFGAVLQRAAMEESGNAGGGDGSKGGGEGKSNSDGEEKGQEEEGESEE
jgi:hypothetical protein